VDAPHPCKAPRAVRARLPRARSASHATLHPLLTAQRGIGAGDLVLLSLAGPPDAEADSRSDAGAGPSPREARRGRPSRRDEPPSPQGLRLRSVAGEAPPAAPDAASPGAPAAAAPPDLPSVAAARHGAVLPGGAAAAGPGRCRVAGRAWASPRVPRGHVALADGVSRSLAAPAAGTRLGVSSPPGAAAPPRPCASARLRLLATPEGRPAGSAPGAPAPPARPAGAPASPRPARRAPGAPAGTPPAAGAPAGRPVPSAVAPPWACRVLSGDAPEPERSLLAALVAGHLAGRELLPGNVVSVPLLGFHSLLLVEAVEGEGVADGAPGAVTAATGVEVVSDAGGAAARWPDAGAGGAAAAAAAAADAPLEAAARAARAAAAGSSGEAAAEAAARGSVLAGRAALGRPVPLAGLGAARAEVRRSVGLSLAHHALLAGVGGAGGLLLHGPPGTGKTSVAVDAARECGAALLVVNGPELTSGFLGDGEAGVRGAFAAARALAPAVLLLDEVDSLAPGRERGAAGASARMAAALGAEMDALSAAGAPRVAVVAATNRPGAVDQSLRRPGRFGREVEVGVPGPAQREEILRAHLRGVRHALPDAAVAEAARRAHGYVGADLAALCSEAALSALRRAVSPGPAAGDAAGDGDLVVTAADLAAAETRVRPSAVREVALEVPRVSWGDVGGLGAVKQSLREAVEWPVRHAAALRGAGAEPPRGVLLYGPPGCAKTLLARAVASEAEMNFLSVKGPELFSKYVGDTERAVAALFATARRAAPAIVFFDEIDGLAAARGDGRQGASVADRVLSQLLSEMDGIRPRAGSREEAAGGVVVVAATNRPDNVDPALLRPGRLDRLLWVPPPDAESRRQILGIHLGRRPLAADVDLDALAARLEGYSGADLAALAREAAVAALEEDLGAPAVERRHVDAALRRVAPSARGEEWEEDSEIFRLFQRGPGAAAA